MIRIMIQMQKRVIKGRRRRYLYFPLNTLFYIDMPFRKRQIQCFREMKLVRVMSKSFGNDGNVQCEHQTVLVGIVMSFLTRKNICHSILLGLMSGQWQWFIVFQFILDDSEILANVLSLQLKEEHVWGAAKPPNHPQFYPPSQRTPLSPVIQHRMDAQNAKTAVQAPPPQPIILTLNDTRAPPAAAIPNVPPPPTVTMLLDPSHSVGPEMTIAVFCNTYDLPPAILEKLTNNGYTHASHLRFVSIADIDAMGFLQGEQNGLRHAFGEWSVPR
jgi:hypothetical protein